MLWQGLQGSREGMAKARRLALCGLLLLRLGGGASEGRWALTVPCQAPRALPRCLAGTS